MCGSFVKAIILIVLITLLAGCGSSATTASVAPTHAAVSPTPIPVLATNEPLSMTAERLMDECAEAMGGAEKVAALETMRSTQYFPDHGSFVRYEIKRPNRVRMGDQLVFDGKRASWLTGEPVPQEEWKDFEIDIAWYIPAFFDYPAEYVGTEVVNGIETYVLQVPLPLGAVMTYNLDAQTYLVYRASARFTIDHQEFNPERIYSDYRVQDGILYPHAFTYEGRTGVFTATMETLEFNVPLGDERFAVPIADELVAFYSERDGNAEIYTIHADGSAETRLTRNRALDTAPDISPDGTQIVFVSDRDGNEEIYRMNSDGSGVMRLTTAPAKDSYPFWSADGARIIFCSQRDDGRTYEVYLMNGDGTDPVRITNNSVSEEWAHLSPDMQKIVYAVGPFPNYSLYVMNADGSDPHQVFSSDKSAAFPKWSRDGGTIAFNHAVFSAGNIVGDICLIDKDGGNWRQITTTGGNSVSEDPYWSPDGSRIVFQSNRTGNFQLYVMNADGGDPVRLTNHRGNDYYPSWGRGAPPPAAALYLQKSTQEFDARDTFQVALGDVDGDGDLDAVFSNMGPNHSQVWLNDGRGLFADSGQELTPQGHGAGLGDLDGDGDLDLFISCATYSDSGGEHHKPSKVYLNDGTGLFRDSGQDLGDTELSANSVDLVDIDTDGDLDAIVMYYEQPYKAYLNDGHGAFAEGGLPMPPEAVAAWGDLDGDGDVDLFFKQRGQGYRVWLNGGAGNLADHWQLSDLQVIWGGVALGDLDGDGDLDAMVANGDNDNSYPTIVLFNDGEGRFTDSGQQLSTTRWGEIGLADLDGDGDLDAFVTNMGRPDEVWLNDGRGYFHDSSLRLGGNNPSRGCAFGDLDADGDIDVFVASFGGVSNVIWLNGE